MGDFQWGIYNEGFLQWGIFKIALNFVNQQPIEERVVLYYDEKWTHCFPSGDLNSFTFENEGKSWTGDITMTHYDEGYAALMFCQNCDCNSGEFRCGLVDSVISTDCDELCVAEHAINLGFGGLPGDTQCSPSDVCRFAVSWNIRGTIINIHLTKLYVYWNPS